MMLALARTSTFRSDATCGILRFPRTAALSSHPGCSGSPSGHRCARLAGLSTPGGRRMLSSLLRRPCCQRQGRHASSSCHLQVVSVSRASSCWRWLAARPSSVARPMRFLFPANVKPVLPTRLQWLSRWASVCASSSDQYSWWKAYVLDSASSAICCQLLGRNADMICHIQRGSVVGPRFCFVSHAVSSTAVMLRAAVIHSLSACTRPPHVGVGSQLGLPQ